MYSSVPFPEMGKGGQENSGDGLPVSDNEQMAHSLIQSFLESYVNNSQSKTNAQHCSHWFPLINTIPFGHRLWLMLRRLFT